MAPLLTRTSAFAAACVFLIMLALAGLCEESRPLLQLHESANSSIPLRHDANSINAYELDQAAAHVANLRALLEGDCHTSDITIDHYETSGVGLPTFQVRIGNSCTNPACSISFIIVHCGMFHTGPVLVNPKVFRRFDESRRTCIVNDGKAIPNADAVVFQYKEIWKQPITFQSARVVCHG